MWHAVQWTGRLLVLPGCVFCGRRLRAGRVCAGCRDDLPWIAHACPRCAEPAASAQAAALPCARCQREPPPWQSCVAPLAYRFPVDRALKALKFRRCLYYAPALATLLLPQLAERLPGVDALAPVPLHRLRQARRGYNQAIEISRPVAAGLGLPILRTVRRTRATRAQPGLDRAARKRNLEAAFGVRGRLECRHPLIVDDVLTTGETCKHLARALLAAGARRVSVLTVARAYGAGVENV